MHTNKKYSAVMPIPSQLKVNDPHVVHETLDGETILLNLRKGLYYSLNDSGSALWDYIQLTGDSEAAVDLLTKDSGAEHENIVSSVNRFLNELIEEELLVAGKGTGAVSQTEVNSMAERLKSFAVDFFPPEMSKYTDMQDLLLLDPIHDVEEEGWPEPKDDE